MRKELLNMLGILMLGYLTVCRKDIELTIAHSQAQLASMYPLRRAADPCSHMYNQTRTSLASPSVVQKTLNPTIACPGRTRKAPNIQHTSYRLPPKVRPRTRLHLPA